MRKKKAFTLIELMIALALLAIMSAIAVGVYRGYVRKAARSHVETDTRNCITCVASELARVALTGGDPDFTSCKRGSRYTQSCSVNCDSDYENCQCTCTGTGIVSGYTCTTSTNSTDINCS
ncbi:MAG: prepilin-type N-terminal cleavage/methylation domain-containing protein [Thermodesulfobacterium sp.]|nr:prepilin-type N-terminal cleavage/methylation domain-containing protein [Thermodesulfobacterium sp.]